MRFRFSALVVGFLLWGIFLLRYQFILLLALAVSAFFFIALLGRRLTVDKAGLLALANYAFWLGSGLIVGAVAFTDLGNSEFVDGDGRVFIYYLPLLVFSVYTTRERDLKSSAKIVSWVAVTTLFLVLLWLAFRPSLLTLHGSNFLGTMTHHTGAGTFFSVVAIFLLITGHVAHRRAPIMLGTGMLLAVVLSGSREAMVALLAVALWYLAKTRRFRLAASVLGISVVLAGMMPIIAPHTFERTARLVAPETVEAVLDQIGSARWEPGKQTNLEGESVNILSRILFWSYATRRFLQSPVVGIGYGRFNDPNLEFVGAEGLLYVATGGDKIFSVLSAHNSYLHVLSESGLIGLALLMGLWGTMYRRLGKGADLAGDDQTKAYFVACQGLVVFATVAALFGHALAAPSIGIPALALVGCGLSYQRRLAAQAARTAEVPNGSRTPRTLDTGNAYA